LCNVAPKKVKIDKIRKIIGASVDEHVNTNHDHKIDQLVIDLEQQTKPVSKEKKRKRLEKTPAN